LEIYLGDKNLLVGSLFYETNEGREFSCFQYSAAWLEAPEAFPLSPDLTLNYDKKFFRGEQLFPPVIMDTLPDAWGKKVLLRALSLGRIQRRENALLYLLFVPDYARSGALRICRKGGAFLAQTDGESWPGFSNLIQFSQIIQDFETNALNWEAFKPFVQPGSSLGGARPKCSILNTKNRLCLAKFTTFRDTMAVEKAEVMTLHLARLCGLDSPESSLTPGFKNLPVALIERFDRDEKGRRRLFISGQTMLNAQEATYAELAEAIRTHSSAPKDDLTSLFKRILFTILICNVDDHLKNHGFLYSGKGKWRLSPVFDINPSPERMKVLKTPIIDLNDDSASLDVLLENSHFFDQSKDVAKIFTKDMAEIIKSNWMKISQAVKMEADEIEVYRPAFEHAEMQNALKISSIRRNVANSRKMK
jgi:serine/threonine-protein kinase HipA